MNTNRLIPILLVFPFALTALACPTREANLPDETGTGGAETQTGGQGGAPRKGSGGAAGNGGAPGFAGGGGTVIAGTGGTAGTTGTGGMVATGGVSGTGGLVATGGVPGTGGVTATGGVTGTGGATATGGLTGTGGVAATGGVTGTGGSPVTCNPSCNSSTQTCVGTTCLLDDGQSCSLASQCVSNKCTPFYVDQDGDGYGTGQATGFCGTAAPVGYAAQNGDCCDTATNIAVAKLIHPGAGFQTTSAGGVCNITWDYNCSGAIERNAQMGVCADSATYPTCETIYSDFPESVCGTSAPASSCGGQSQGSNGYCTVHGANATLGCR
jgi:hypothetical protein